MPLTEEEHLKEMDLQYLEQDNDPDFCVTCGDSTDWHNLIECSFCKKFRHRKCDPFLEDLKVTPTGHYFCSDKCATQFDLAKPDPLLRFAPENPCISFRDEANEGDTTLMT